VQAARVILVVMGVMVEMVVIMAPGVGVEEQQEMGLHLELEVPEVQEFV
jgi:hypothetical protein